MTMTSKLLSALAIVALAVAGRAGAQEMKEASVKNEIVGVWWVTSVVNEADEKKTTPFGANPKGMFVFTADGHFSTNIVNPQHAKFAANNRMTGTPEENKDAVQGNISLFGNYTVSSDGSINLEIVASSFPNWDGAKQKRVAEIKGDAMKWMNPTASTGGSAVISLQRAKTGDRYPQQ